MDYDGLTQFSDAQTRQAQAQADIADKVAGIPAKLAQAELIHQQAVHQALENVAKFLEIKWDAQAHDHLLRMRTLALQSARAARIEAGYFRNHVGRLSWIMSGSADSLGTTSGWIAFHYVLQHLPAAIAIKALAHQPDAAAFAIESWKQPNSKIFEMIADRDGGSLLDWARKTNHYPRLGSPAWVWLSAIIEQLASGAQEQAAAIRAAVDKAEAAARQLEQLDWDRLNKNKKPD